MSRPIKIAIVIIFFLLIVGAAHTVIVYVLKQRLVEGWSEMSKEQGIIINKEIFRKELDKLNIFELMKVAKFSRYLGDHKYQQAFGMWPEIKPIITQKAHLMGQGGFLHLLIG